MLVFIAQAPTAVGYTEYSIQPARQLALVEYTQGIRTDRTTVCYHLEYYRPVISTRGQSNLTKSASRGAHSPVRGLEICTIEFLG